MKTPEDTVHASAQFLCGAQELSESQILDADTHPWMPQAYLQNIEIYKFFVVRQAWHKA
jgi:hypothetical protein